jgi:hypothetical protein
MEYAVEPLLPVADFRPLRGRKTQCGRPGNLESIERFDLRAPAIDVSQTMIADANKI